MHKLCHITSGWEIIELSTVAAYELAQGHLKGIPLWPNEIKNRKKIDVIDWYEKKTKRVVPDTVQLGQVLGAENVQRRRGLGICIEAVS